jgi:hypothetical protein
MPKLIGMYPQAVAKLKRIQEKEGRTHVKMLSPCCWMKPWRLDAQFLTRSALGSTHYVFMYTYMYIYIYVASWCLRYVAE